MFARLTSQLEKVGITSTAATSSTGASSTSNGEKQQEDAVAQQSHRPIRALDPAVEKALTAAGIPLVSCMDCPAPCDPDNPSADASDIFDAKLLSAWRRQDIDYDEVMFPTNSPFLRHVMISTGKRDWPKDIASVRGSLAQLFERWSEEASARPQKGLPASASDGEARTGPALPKGCWGTAPDAHDRPSRLIIGNSSHVSSSSRATGQSVLLFPDYVMVQDVPDATEAGDIAADTEGGDPTTTAKSAFDAFISPSAPGTDAAPPPADSDSDSSTHTAQATRAGVRRYVLPYRAVIALCSHKKRDARCGISAPMLAEVFRRHAEAAGWDVDERGDEVGHGASASASASARASTAQGQGQGAELHWGEDGVVTNRGWGYIHDGEACPHSAAHQSAAWRRQLCGVSSSSSASSGGRSPSSAAASSAPSPSLLILHTSHIGKHKYAGNVLLYFPNGSGVWYGRVDPFEGAARVWEQTVLRGRVIGEYLRVGVNLWRGVGEGEEGQAEGEGEGGGEGKRISGSKAQLEGAGRGKGILAW